MTLHSRGVLTRSGPHAVDNGVVVQVNAPTDDEWYSPWEHKEIPTEFARLREADERAVLDFVDRWGVLGYLPMFVSQNINEIDRLSVLRRNGRIGEPLWWIWNHARTIRLLFTLLANIWGRNEAALRAYLDEIMPDGTLEFAYGVHRNQVMALSPQNLSGPLAEAATIVHGIITPNMDMLRPELMMFDSQTGELAWSHSTPALLPVVYAHIATAAVRSYGYYQCAYRLCDLMWPSECRQGPPRQYCPPDGTSSESRCSRKERYRREQETKKREASNG